MQAPMQAQKLLYINNFLKNCLVNREIVEVFYDLIDISENNIYHEEIQVFKEIFPKSKKNTKTTLYNCKYLSF